MTAWSSSETPLGTPDVLPAFRSSRGDWVVPVRLGPMLSIRVTTVEEAEAVADAFREASRRLFERQS